MSTTTLRIDKRLSKRVRKHLDSGGEKLSKGLAAAILDAFGDDLDEHEATIVDNEPDRSGPAVVPWGWEIPGADNLAEYLNEFGLDIDDDRREELEDGEPPTEDEIVTIREAWFDEKLSGSDDEFPSWVILALESPDGETVYAPEVVGDGGVFSDVTREVLGIYATLEEAYARIQEFGVVEMEQVAELGAGEPPAAGPRGVGLGPW